MNIDERLQQKQQEVKDLVPLLQSIVTERSTLFSVQPDTIVRHQHNVLSFDLTFVENTDKTPRALRQVVQIEEIFMEQQRMDYENLAAAVENSNFEVMDMNYESREMFRFNNSECYMCNGFYGPCFEDPTCSVCHAFLHPNAAPNITTFEKFSDDSDSGNDEPTDTVYRRNLSSEPGFRQIDENHTPPVRIEDLEQNLNRLSTTQHIIELNIEQLPPEVLLLVFKYLDEISLWSVGQVSTHWKEILDMNVRPDRWKSFTLLRWPILYPSSKTQDWYALYTTMMQSICCLKCVKQMAAQECDEVEENSWRKHRLGTELRTMRLDPLEGIRAKPLDSACCHWQATIQGPTGSPYEGGLFFLYIQVPYTYPMSPPVVRFLTKIFHPNISRHGDIGIDSIHHNWSLALTISKILLSIQSLLTDPYCDVCMESEIGILYIYHRKEFDEQARLWTWKYAMNDIQLF